MTDFNPAETLSALQAQRIDLPGIANARQLGGYICADGRRVKPGLLLRTAGLDGASDEVVEKLSQEFKVRYVVDFRMPPEAALKPDREIPGAKYINIQVMEMDESSPESIEATQKIRAAGDEIGKIIEYVNTGALSGLYSGILFSNTGRQGFAEFFKILLESKGSAVLWHCAFGKDRTGLAAALLLYALGADDETVMADFVLTNQFLSDKIEIMKNELKRRGCSEAMQNESEAISGVSGEYLRSALEQMRTEYGSVIGYIKALGLDDRDIAELRKSYLE